MIDAVYRLTGYVRGRTNQNAIIPWRHTKFGDFRRSGQHAHIPNLQGQPAQEQDWTLDGIGNWAQVETNGTIQTATAGSINQYTAFDGHLLDHASNGLTIADVPTVAGTGLAYEYDAFERLRRVFDPATNTTVGLYDYDASGRRIVRHADFDRDGSFDLGVRYIFDGAREIEERDIADNHALLREYVFGLYIDEPVWQADGAGNQRLFGQDENFNVYAVLNLAGQPLEFVRYDAYGTFQCYAANGSESGAANSPSALTDLLFQGRRFDAESGLYFYRARFYNPKTGRFTAFDPTGYTDGMGLFAAFGNNPISHLDPSGNRVEIHWDPMDAWHNFWAMGAGVLDSVVLSDLTGWTPGKDMYLGVFGDTGGDWCDVYHFGKQFKDAFDMALGLPALAKLAAKGWKYANQALKAALGAESKQFSVACSTFKNMGPRSQQLIRDADAAIMCFVEGTPVWTLKADVDVDAANTALAVGTDWRDLAEMRPIESIEAGDFVISKPEDDPSAAPTFELVTQTYIRETRQLIWLGLFEPESGATDELGITPHHPVWLESTGDSGDTVPLVDLAGCELHQNNRYQTTDGHGASASDRSPDSQNRWLRADHGWVFPRDLKTGYVLTSLDGRRVVVIAVKLEQARRKVYNFAVNRTHTYAVGSTWTWVHNANKYKNQPGYLLLASPKNPNVRRWQKAPNSPYILFNNTHSGSMPKPKGKGPGGGNLQSHHGLQQEWAIANLPNYKPRLAPSVTLETGAGPPPFPHSIISNAQNARRNARVAAGNQKWGSTIDEELQYIVDDFTAAGFNKTVIQSVLDQQYAMLNKMGIPFTKPTGY